MRAFFRVGFIGIVLLLATIARPQTTEKASLTERDEIVAIQERVCRLLAAEDFDALEAMANQLRDNKVIVSWGAWKLYFYYRGYGYDRKVFDPNRRAECIAMFERWKKLNPKSVTPRIFLSKMYVDYAWKSRGGGWASSVTEEGWKGFQENLAKAAVELKEAEALNPNDPVLYEMEVLVGRGMNASRSAIEEIDVKARKIAPPHLGYYYERMICLLPRWGGAKGDVEAFAARTADATRESHGDIHYAFLANAASDWTDTDVFTEFGFKWPRVKKGFEEWVARVKEPHLHQQSFCLMACQQGDRETAAALFKSDKIGAEPDTSIWGNAKIFASWRKWAVENGPSPNSPLILAIRNGDLPAIARELDAGADVNAFSPAGDTLLCLALGSRSDEVIELLLKRGADPSIPRESDQWCPLQIAIQRRRFGAMKAILEHTTTFQPKDKERWHPLILATSYENADAVKVLLAHPSTDINAIDPSGRTALHYAAIKGLADIVTLLLDAGADVDPLDFRGASPYVRALAHENKECQRVFAKRLEKIIPEIEARVKAGGDVNAFLSDRKPPLLSAIELRLVDKVEALLKLRADPNRPGASGARPLTTAVAHNLTDAIPLLLAAGADPALSDRSGKTALDIARERNNKEAVRLLEEAAKKK